jgi:hypothetical protein
MEKWFDMCQVGGLVDAAYGEALLLYNTHIIHDGAQ